MCQYMYLHFKCLFRAAAGLQPQRHSKGYTVEQEKQIRLDATQAALIKDLSQHFFPCPPRTMQHTTQRNMRTARSTSGCGADDAGIAPSRITSSANTATAVPHDEGIISTQSQTLSQQLNIHQEECNLDGDLRTENAEVPPAPLESSDDVVGDVSINDMRGGHALQLHAQKNSKSSRLPTVLQLMFACAAYLMRKYGASRNSLTELRSALQRMRMCNLRN